MIETAGRNQNVDESSVVDQVGTLEFLAAENSSLKEDLEYKLSQMADLKDTVEEYSVKIESKIADGEELWT